MATLEIKFAILGIFLITHFTAFYKKWYYTNPHIDTITHFLGGLAVGAFIKDWAIAIALIIAWEFLEMLMVSKYWLAFRETPINKVQDVLFGLLGFFIAVDVF